MRREFEIFTGRGSQLSGLTAKFVLSHESLNP